MARPASLTQELIDSIVHYWTHGSTYEEIVRVLGIAERSFYRWLQKGRQGKQPYSQLWQALERARPDRRIALLRKIEAAADRNWMAAAWILEREFPEMYAKPEVRLRLAGNEQVEITE